MHLLLLFLTTASVVLSSSVKHEQVVLSFHGDTTAMPVTWISLNDLDKRDTPFVSYGLHPTALTTRVNATVTKWTDRGSNKVSRNTYRAKMIGLSPGSRYYYKVGSLGSSFSETFNFRALNASWPTVKVGVYGDLGTKDGYSIEPLIEATQKHYFDIVFHIGDIAYDLDDDNGYHGDHFMNSIQNMTAYVPWMVVAGNHESAQGFNHYTNRFTMPANGVTGDNQFWSFTFGNTHFIGLSTEYYGSGMKTQAQQQYNWLLNDLKKNNASWTVAFMHRPMYCSNSHPSGCQDSEELMTRNGENGLPALEPLFNSGGIDLLFWGHKHSYERNWPVYKSVVHYQNDKNYYHNAATPVYIMTGAAGTHDHSYPDEKFKQKYTNVMHGEYGYNYLNIVSPVQVQTGFVVTKGTSGILDKFTLSKDYKYKPGQNLNIKL